MAATGNESASRKMISDSINNSEAEAGTSATFGECIAYFAVSLDCLQQQSCQRFLFRFKEILTACKCLFECAKGAHRMWLWLAFGETTYA